MSESTELTVTQEPMMSLGIIAARTPHDVIVQATTIAKELSKIVKDNNLSVTIQNRKFVKVEGWSTMGAMLGVLPREMTEAFRSFEDGSCEASVELIRISDSAVIGRASAFVGMDEKDRNGKLTWGSRAMYARRSMAVTRATGKAYRLGFSWIMTLAGYEATPAEEMEGVIDGQTRDVTPPHPTEEPKGNGHEPEKPNTETIDLINAKARKGHDGRFYGDLNDEELQKKLDDLNDALERVNSPAKKEPIKAAMNDIKLILADKAKFVADELMNH